MSIIKELFTPFNNLAELPDKVDLESLFKEFYDRLVYFSIQFVKDEDEAQDIVQDSFIKYWNQREMVAPNRIAIKNFLYSTVRNASLNVIRHEKVREGYAQQQQQQQCAEPEEPPVIDAIIAAEVMSKIHAAVQSLPESHRQISVMGYFDGKKNNEIADELNMSVNTVKKQKQRALQLLRMKLEPEMFALFFILMMKFLGKQ